MNEFEDPPIYQSHKERRQSNHAYSSSSLFESDEIHINTPYEDIGIISTQIEQIPSEPSLAVDSTHDNTIPMVGLDNVL